jgi:mono/diheme cytochrome c family protein
VTRRTGIMALAVLLLIFAGIALLVWIGGFSSGFSAREEPSALERELSDGFRRLAMPKRAKTLKNPVPNSPEALAEARAHWADHCASCHANNGSGDTQIGRSLYPKAPDMRSSGTQSLSDGEIYYLIQNGVRLTGMPAWGTADDGDANQDSWKLVLFIRHLPEMTEQEANSMQKLNPKTAEEWEEEKTEQEFLDGSAPSGSASPHHH